LKIDFVQISATEFCGFGGFALVAIAVPLQAGIVAVRPTWRFQHEGGLPFHVVIHEIVEHVGGGHL
jgi:hypothetical protein